MCRSRRPLLPPAHSVQFRCGLPTNVSIRCHRRVHGGFPRADARTARDRNRLNVSKSVNVLKKRVTRTWKKKNVRRKPKIWVFRHISAERCARRRSSNIAEERKKTKQKKRSNVAPRIYEV